MWIALSLGAALFYAIATILDRYISGEEFDNLGALLFYTSVANVVFLPLLWIGGVPGLLPIRFIPYALLIGTIEFSYYALYYKALDCDDTSVVGSLFSIGKIFIPIGAFFILGEKLFPIQYAGFVVTIVACALLSIQSFKKDGLSRALIYMIPCSILISAQTIASKYVLGFLPWETIFFWSMISCMFVACSMLFFQKSRVAIRNGFSKKGLLAFGFEEIFAFFAATFSIAAISRADATKVSGLIAISPVFILILGFIGSKWKPHLFRENTKKQQIVKKIILFIIIAVGAYFIGGE